ncbi:MAG: hypothetical protein DHS80DRAFT_24481 [Piptocephalis tieghemiana]|nr:MAG: hypothetical protein DHS80DRAFT_24481 [Piptocephalis tieghemiana]
MHTSHLLLSLALLVVIVSAHPAPAVLRRRDIDDLNDEQTRVFEDAHHQISEADGDEEAIADANIEAAERMARLNEEAQRHGQEDEGWDEDHLVKREENTVARQAAIAAEAQRQILAASGNPEAEAAAIRHATEETDKLNRGSTHGQPMPRSAQ